MKEIRPKINEGELALLLGAMKNSEWDRLSETGASDPRYQLYRRFLALQEGRHVKKRIVGPFALAFDFRRKREKQSG